MKKLLLFACLIFLLQISYGQSEHKISPDVYRVRYKAHRAFSAVAKERNVELTDHAAMSAIGTDLAKNMVQENCKAFIKLPLAMAKKHVDNKLIVLITRLLPQLSGFLNVLI